MPEEIWRDIKGYEGKYQVSNFGRVKSLCRTVRYKNRYGKISIAKVNGKTKNMTMNSNGWREGKGYLSVMLYKNNKGRRHNVHRLVAEAFIPNLHNLSQVNHIDGDKTNNRVDNLEWCTQSENMQHAAHEIKVLKSMYKPIPVKCLETGEKFRSTSEAARAMKLDRRALSQAVADNKPFCGYHWARTTK